MIQYLHPFLAARNTRASTPLGKVTLVIPHCRTDQFIWSFLPAAVRLWNLLPSGMLSGGTLSSFKSVMNLCLLSLHDFSLSVFQSLFAVL